MRNIPCQFCGNVNYRDLGKGKDLCLSCGGEFEDTPDRGEQDILLTQAAAFLRKGDFDDAIASYADIIEQYPDCHEAWFGLAKSRHGIVVVFDKMFEKYVPTCYSISESSFFKEEGYLKAIELAPPDEAEGYKSFAEKIEDIRKEWLEKVSKEEPYDIFISFKASDDKTKERTDDYNFAFDLYNQLSTKYKVFFSPVTLKQIASEKYEPYIFNALKTAPIMILYGSKKEYLEATWVKNEWKRFIKLIAKGEKSMQGLMVCCTSTGILPAEFTDTQVRETNDLKFFQKLEDDIEKHIKASKKIDAIIEAPEIQRQVSKKASKVVNKNVDTTELIVSPIQNVTPSEEGKLRFAKRYLDSSDFAKALAIYEEIVKGNEYSYEAMWGTLLARNSVKNADDFLISLVTNKMYQTYNLEEFAKIIKITPKDIAQTYIQVYVRACNKILEQSTKEALPFFKAIVPFRQGFDSKSFIANYASKAALSDETSFQFALSYVEDVDDNIALLHIFANNQLQLGNFLVATKYVDKIFELDSGNIEAFWLRMYISLRAKNATEFSLRAHSFSRFDIFEDILRYCESAKEQNKHKETLLSAVAFSVTKEGGLDVLTKAVTYCNASMRKKYFYIAGDKMLAEGRFQEAINIYALILAENKEEYKAYWGVTLAKAECRNEREFETTEYDFEEFPEFNSAIEMADVSGNSLDAERYFSFIGKNKATRERIAHEKEEERKRQVLQQQEAKRIQQEKKEREREGRIAKRKQKAIRDSAVTKTFFVPVIAIALLFTNIGIIEYIGASSGVVKWVFCVGINAPTGVIMGLYLNSTNVPSKLVATFKLILTLGTAIAILVFDFVVMGLDTRVWFFTVLFLLISIVGISIFASDKDDPSPVGGASLVAVIAMHSSNYIPVFNEYAILMLIGYLITLVLGLGCAVGLYTTCVVGRRKIVKLVFGIILSIGAAVFAIMIGPFSLATQFEFNDKMYFPLKKDAKVDVDLDSNNSILADPRVFVPFNDFYVEQ